MSDTLMELYAKPAVSVLLQQNDNQRLVSQLLYQASHQNDSQSIDQFNKQIHRKMAKFTFGVYQKMMLSIETLLLAFQIMETHEFRNLIQEEIEKHRFYSKRSQFNSVNLLKSQLYEKSSPDSQQKITSLLLNIYSISLLYLCHKITDDFVNKFTSNIWLQNLHLQHILTTQDIKLAQGKIYQSLQCDILRPTIFRLVSIMMDQMNIHKAQFAHFVHYLLEIYLNTNVRKFIGEKNRLKRVNLVLGGMKLACHFLCPRLWNARVMREFNFNMENVEKYSRILFGLFLDKENNILIHEKYKMSRYKGVSSIKIVSSIKSQGSLRESTESESQEQSEGSEQDNHNRISASQRREKQFESQKLMRVSC